MLPEFADRDEAHQQAKRRRLEPVLDAALARKPAADHPPLPTPDYAFPAIPRALADRSGSDEFHRWLDDLAAKTSTGDTQDFRDLLA